MHDLFYKEKNKQDTIIIHRELEIIQEGRNYLQLNIALGNLTEKWRKFFVFFFEYPEYKMTEYREQLSDFWHKELLPKKVAVVTE